MDLKGKRIAILAENLYEDMELWVPYYRMLEAGCDVKILGTGKGHYTSKHDYPVDEDMAVDDAAPKDFDAVIIPGGYAPDHMRRHRPLVDFVRNMNESGKIVAFICHAGWVAASADIVRGKQVTSVAAIQDDLKNAGAKWVDRECVRDGNLITSRRPPDLPAFCKTIIAALAEQR